MEEVDDFNFSEQQKQDVIDVLKKFGFYDEWKDYIDQICEEMYNVHKYSKVQLKQIDKEGVQAILNDVDSGWLEEHDDYVEESKKINTSKKHLIKENSYSQYREELGEKADEYLENGISDAYNAISNIIKQNPDKVAALDNKLYNFCKTNYDSQDFYQDIIEGNEGYADQNVFTGLKDPKTFTDLGFKVSPEDAAILKQYYVLVNDGDTYWNGMEPERMDEPCAEKLKEWGLRKTARLLKRMMQEY